MRLDWPGRVDSRHNSLEGAYAMIAGICNCLSSTAILVIMWVGLAIIICVVIWMFWGRRR
jgi:hypothetical protein